MKILQVVQMYYPSVGGTQILFQKICEKCVAMYREDIEVYTTNSYYGPDRFTFKKVEPASEIINGVKVVRFPFRRWHRKPFAFAKTILYRLFKIRLSYISERLAGPWSPELFKAMASTDADVISGATSGYMHMTYPLWRHKLRHPKPFVFQGAFHFQEGDPGLPFNNRILNAIKASEYYLCNTVYEKDRLVEAGVDGEKIVITGCGVDLEKFENGSPSAFRQQLNLADNDVLVSYVGRVDGHKSVDVLAKAFALLCEKTSNVHLAFAGMSTPYSAVLKRLTSTFPDSVKDKIHFRENLSEDEKISIYHATDIMVLPSVNESFGIVFLEAWACRKPVIGADIGAVRSVITDMSDGLLMQPGNACDLCEKLQILIHNPALRIEMGNNGYNKVAENYTWEIVTAKYRDTCKKAVEKFNAAKSSKKHPA